MKAFATIDIEMLDTKGVATKGAMQSILATCAKVHSDAVALCPVDLGQLRSSIMFTVDGQETGFNSQGGQTAPDSQQISLRSTEIVGYVGTNSDHWYPEFGTRFQVAQPFLRPAGEMAKGGSADQVATRYCRKTMLDEFNRRGMKKI